MKLNHNYNLQELAKKYGTDKLEHGYIDFYTRYFEKYKEKSINLLEIGVKYGDSIWMWHDYFKNGKIYGIDILNNAGYYKRFHKTYNTKKKNNVALWPNEETGELSKYAHLPKNQQAQLLEETKSKILNSLPKNRFSLIIGDQSDTKDLKRVVDECVGEFDIIIDDGFHAAAHQQISLDFLFRYLKPGGIYVIEDLHMGTSRDRDNTMDPTNKVLKNFLDTDKFSSDFISDGSYLEENIESVEWPSANEKICFIRKVLHRTPNSLKAS